jgi:xylan 1,4-beta-xylosidase
VTGGGYGFEDILAGSVRGENDIDALASLSDRSLAVMVWNYHDADLSGPDAEVALQIEGIPAERARLHHYRIDSRHSNSYEVWKAMGSPQDPTPAQVRRLEEAGGLDELHAPRTVDLTAGTDAVTFTLPRQGVSLLLYTW